MKVKISRAVALVVGVKHLEEFGLHDGDWYWRHGQKIDLSKVTDVQLKKLEALFDKHADVNDGAKLLLRDVRTWKAAKTNVAGVKARKIEHFETLLKEYLVQFPGPRLYRQDEAGLWEAYYVNEIEFHEAEKWSPARVVMTLVWEDFGGTHSREVRFIQSDVSGKVISEIVLAAGYYVETDVLRALYLAEHERFMDIIGRIGKQYNAIGTGVDDLDGNARDGERAWYRESQTIHFVRDGEPARVVIDVFSEAGRENERNATLDPNFWKSKEDDEVDRVIEVPVHHDVPVFDLKRHLRMRTHVENLSEYVYDDKIAEKLVLPDELKSLVQMLVEHKDAGFKDIVRGKSGGAVVLLAGPPGVGKTLTAEVFAENEKRALYSVQCSQLGTTADELENELLKVFARARRWNAVLLLDEADVYVHSRGMNMEQNAIVGVFLRVLEYQTTVMFMTTNRPDDVDDAVLSRCLARLVYDYPTKEEQWRIWKVLAAGVGILVDESVKRDIVAIHKLSGRDVKNLIKLSILMSKGNPKVTADHVTTAMQFHPTIHKS